MSSVADTRTLEVATSLLKVAEGMFAVDALAAGLVTFRLPDLISEGTSTLGALARAAGMSERACTVVVTILCAHGVLDWDRDGNLTLTQDGALYALTRSPASLIPVYEPLTMRSDCKELTEAMRASTSASTVSANLSPGPPEGPDLDWTAGMSELDFARMFLHSTDARNRVLAGRLSETLTLRGTRLVDIAGGSGIYTSHLLDGRPELSAVILEQSPVDTITREHVAAARLGGRVSVRTCNIFTDPLPSGFTDALLSNVIHDWEPDQVAGIIAKAFTALEAGGQIAIHDVFIDPDDESTFTAAAEYSALLMKYTQGRAYTITEVRDFVERAGFRGLRLTPTTAYRAVLTAHRPQEAP